MVELILNDTREPHQTKPMTIDVSVIRFHTSWPRGGMAIRGKVLEAAVRGHPHQREFGVIAEQAIAHDTDGTVLRYSVKIHLVLGIQEVRSRYHVSPHSFARMGVREVWSHDTSVRTINDWRVSLG